MGRYEDLLATAREEGPDSTAWDTLQEEFGVSTLREKAEQADALQAKYQKALPGLRKARIEELVGKLPDDLREAGLDVSDFGDFDPDDLTLEQVQDRAVSKRESAQAQRLAAATDAGFDSVEEYDSALAAVKEQRQQRQAGMEDVGAGVASGGGGPTDLEQEETPFDAGKKAFEDAKTAGRADDYAMAESITAILDAQSSPVDEE